MSSKRIVMAGLIAGFVTILVVALVVAAVGPDVAVPSAPASPVLPPVSASPTASSTAGVGPSSSAAPGASVPSASSSAGASGPASAAALSSSGGVAAASNVGSPAPALDVPQLGGGRIHLAALRGKPVWLDFTTTSCSSCRDDAAAMTSFVERYHAQGLVAIAVVVREDESSVAGFASSLDGTYPIALDTDGAAAQAWSVATLPTHFFVDASGVVRAAAPGSVGRDVLARSLQTVLPGVTVTP